jgi:hypothetical protein
MFLHAAQMRFDHPGDGARVTVAAALPAELQRVAEELLQA